MKPFDRRAKSSQSGLSRVRMKIKADLWWLSGFPVSSSRTGAVRWLAVPFGEHREPEEVALERKHLSRATHAMTELKGHFARAMPLVVGDVERWEDGVSQALDSLKACINRKGGLARSLFQSKGPYKPTACARAKELQSDSPSLKRLLDAVSWAYCGRPDRVSRSPRRRCPRRYLPRQPALRARAGCGRDRPRTLCGTWRSTGVRSSAGLTSRCRTAPSLDSDRLLTLYRIITCLTMGQ